MEVIIEIKRTTHLTPCQFCHKEIIKGEFRLTLRSNGYHAQDSFYAHPVCFQHFMEEEVVEILTKGDKNELAINPSLRNQNGNYKK
jgi:hypothetical protein